MFRGLIRIELKDERGEDSVEVQIRSDQGVQEPIHAWLCVLTVDLIFSTFTYRIQGVTTPTRPTYTITACSSMLMNLEGQGGFLHRDRYSVTPSTT